MEYFDREHLKEHLLILKEEVKRLEHILFGKCDHDYEQFAHDYWMCFKCDHVTHTDPEEH